MAKVSEELKEKIVAQWQAGRTQGWLAKEHNLSKATINKFCKGVEQVNVDLVNAQVAIKTELAPQSEQKVNAVNELVDERTRHLIYFQNSAMRNQKLANEVLEREAQKSGDDALGMVALEAHARITGRNKETVLGKQPENAIQINNNQPPSAVSVEFLDA